MKLNLAITASQVEAARKPALGLECDVYFAPESGIHLGTVRATGATTFEYASAGGSGIPTGGRDVHVRVASPEFLGVVGAAAVTFNVTMDDDSVDTAVATFHIPSTTEAVNLNRFPIGIAADLVPTTVGNAAKKIKTITSVASVVNMTAGNTLEVYTTPNSADFVHIGCTTTKGGEFKLPKVVEIPCGRDPAAFVKFGRAETKNLNIGFKERGALEGLNRFNGCRGSVRFDINKDGYVISQRIVFSGFLVSASAEYGDGDDVVEAKAEGPYEQFSIGYYRVSG